MLLITLIQLCMKALIIELKGRYEQVTIIYNMVNFLLITIMNINDTSVKLVKVSTNYMVSVWVFC